MIEAPLGKGRVLLFGPEIIKRAQPHGTFKFLFNGIYSLGGRILKAWARVNDHPGPFIAVTEARTIPARSGS